MVAGAVTSAILAKPFTTTQLNTAVGTLRVGAGDKWLLSQTADQLIIVNIEET